MSGLKRTVLFGLAVLVSGCENSPTLAIEPKRNEIAGSFTAYVTSWLNLDQKLAHEIVKSGGQGLDFRIKDGHHEVRCLAVLQYAYASVAFEADPNYFYRYRVDCKHDQGTAG